MHRDRMILLQAIAFGGNVIVTYSFYVPTTKYFKVCKFKIIPSKYVYCESL